MYSFDTSINTAVERQADRMHAVRAMNSSPSSQQSAPDWTDGQGRQGPMIAKAALTLAAAAPIALALVWVLAR
jgi:hypothetical protein